MIGGKKHDDDRDSWNLNFPTFFCLPLLSFQMIMLNSDFVSYLVILLTVYHI